MLSLKREYKSIVQDNHPNAMALSVLVTIEMLNAMNRCELGGEEQL